MRTALGFCRHISLEAALIEHGISEPEARRLVEAATLIEIQIESAGRLFAVRRMRGGHADIHEVGARGGGGASDAFE